MSATATIPVHSPLDGRLLAEPETMDADRVREAVAAARRAQAEWWQRPLAERLRILRRLAPILADRRDALAATVRAETGKPRAEAMAEILAAQEAIHFYAGPGARILRTEPVPTGWIKGKQAWIEREPYGVIGAITPWNYPLLLTLDAVLAAIFGGNAVVVKPSEFTPMSTLAIPPLLDEAGVTPGLMQVVTGDGATGAALVAGGVDKVVFTGSSATGSKVMAAAAAHLVPVVLELGGKDPAIVLRDADLDRAAHGIVYGALFNAGQTCISTERVYVERTVHDEFVARVAAIMERIRPGTDDAADMGPLVTPAQRDVVRSHIGDAIARGAEVRVGGLPDDPATRLIPPTLLTAVDESMLVASAETFGPVVAVIPVDDAEEAVRRANATDYGLFASVWTRDTERGRRIASQLKCGGVSVNDTLSHYAVAALPMGGVGASGFGRRRGLAGLEEMTRPRSVLVHRWGPRREPWWMPYSALGGRLAEAIVVLRGHGWLGGLARAVALLRGRGGR